MKPHPSDIGLRICGDASLLHQARVLAGFRRRGMEGERALPAAEAMMIGRVGTGGGAGFTLDVAIVEMARLLQSGTAL